MLKPVYPYPTRIFERYGYKLVVIDLPKLKFLPTGLARLVTYVQEQSGKFVMDWEAIGELVLDWEFPNPDTTPPFSRENWRLYMVGLPTELINDVARFITNYLTSEECAKLLSRSDINFTPPNQQATSGKRQSKKS